MTKVRNADTRVVALVGPFSSGKTTLLEKLVTHEKDTRFRQTGERVFADNSIEAQTLSMGINLNLASVDFLGDPYVFIDCPGSIEFLQEARSAIHAADVAVVVAEPALDKLQMLSPILHELETKKIPHLLFFNKLDQSEVRISDLVTALSDISILPVLLRQIPIREDGVVTGYVDLAAKRAYQYIEDDKAKSIDIPDTVSDRLDNERFSMLETLSDFHDHLLEELLEDIDPPLEEVFDDLAADHAASRIMPVLFGSALHGYGLNRLMKAIRHEVPPSNALDRQLFVGDTPDPSVFVIKVSHDTHTGKTALVRVINGKINEGGALDGDRIAGLLGINGAKTEKKKEASVGDIVWIPRLEAAKAGEAIGAKLDGVNILSPVYSKSIQLENDNEEAKLTESLMKLTEEDPSYSTYFEPDTQELILWGQGEMHLRAATVRMKEKYGVSIRLETPTVPYKETIRTKKKQHSRFKKQSGGHGQFGDVVIEVTPLAKGQGFAFATEVTGGAIPKQYIPSVEAGVKDYLSCGPLGFPVVDVGVTLKDGTYHSVDSSDLAFKTAGRMAMAAALPECSPVLLEPVEKVCVMVPIAYTAKVNGLIMTRRGQIQSYDSRPGWPGWDQVDAFIPQAEIADLIIELRSMTLGTGTFEHNFDHLTELAGRDREKVLSHLLQKGHGVQ